MNCASCNQGLTTPLTVVHGQVAHHGSCADHLRREYAEKQRKEQGVQAIGTWTAKWKTDEFGTYHEDPCNCPTCLEDEFVDHTIEPEEEGIEFDGE